MYAMLHHCFNYIPLYIITGEPINVTVSAAASVICALKPKKVFILHQTKITNLTRTTMGLIF